MAADAPKLMQSYRELQTARNRYTADWKDAERFCLPHARKETPIHDSHGYRAARNLASGIFSNTYMPGRQWFSMVANDGADDLDEVKTWLARLTEAIQAMIAVSNFPAQYYQALLGAGVTGVGVLYCGVRKGKLYTRSYPASTVCYSFSVQDELDMIFREFELSPRQAMAEFPDMPANCSARKEFETNPLSQKPFKFLHAVFARDKINRKRKDSKNLPYASVYLDVETEGVVEESGYATMPYAVLRFYKSDTDYGVGPGVAVLPELRLLNSMKADYLAALELKINPPVFLPGAAGDQKISMKPGAVNYTGGNGGESMPVFLPTQGVSLNEVAQHMQECRAQIDDEFFTSVLYQLAMAAAAQNNPQMTAREVEERSDEKVLVLAPVVSRLYSEFLNAVVIRVLDLALEHGMAPTPPAVLLQTGDGIPASIRYLSRLDAKINEIMMRNTLFAAQNVAQLQATAAQVPELGDMLDIRKASRSILFALNVEADVIRTEKQADESLQARQAAQAQAAQQAQAAAMVKPIDSQKAAEPGSPVAQLQGGNPNG